MTTQGFLLFRKWDVSQIEIKDVGLKTAISLKETIFPMDFGRSALKRFNKANVNIVERLVNKMMHFGKKYAKNTGRMAGKKIHGYNVAKAAFEIIYQKKRDEMIQKNNFKISEISRGLASLLQKGIIIKENNMYSIHDRLIAYMRVKADCDYPTAINESRMI